MVLYGCRGNTKQQLSKTLFGIEIREEDYDAIYNEIKNLIESAVKSRNDILQSSNFIYIHNEFDMFEKFRDTLKRCFHTEEISINFNDETMVV